MPFANYGFAFGLARARARRGRALDTWVYVMISGSVGAQAAGYRALGNSPGGQYGRAGFGAGVVAL